MISFFSIKIPLAVFFFLFSLFVSCFSRNINRCRDNHDFIMYKVVITQLPWSHEKTVTMASLKRHYHLETLVTLVMGFFFCFKCRQDRHPIQTLLSSLPLPPHTHLVQVQSEMVRTSEKAVITIRKNLVPFNQLKLRTKNRDVQRLRWAIMNITPMVTEMGPGKNGP